MSIYVNDRGMVTDIYSKLFDDRIIFLDTDINPESANLIKAQLLYLDQLSNDPIKLYIDSPGGEVYTGMGIIDTMDYINSDVETVNIGLAASMAAVILCNGSTRKSLPNSRTLLHQPLGGVYGQSSDIEIASKEIKKIKNILYKIISKRTGRSMKDVYIDADRDYWMNPKEALKYGVIDEIVKKKE